MIRNQGRCWTLLDACRCCRLALHFFTLAGAQQQQQQQNQLHFLPAMIFNVFKQYSHPSLGSVPGSSKSSLPLCAEPSFPLLNLIFWCCYLTTTATYMIALLFVLLVLYGSLQPVLLDAFAIALRLFCSFFIVCVIDSFVMLLHCIADSQSVCCLAWWRGFAACCNFIVRYRFVAAALVVFIPVNAYKQRF